MEKLEIVKNLIRNRRSGSGPDYRDAVAVLLFIFLLPYIVSFFFGNAGMEAKGGETADVQGGERQEQGWDEEPELFREDMEKAEFIVCKDRKSTRLNSSH